MLIRIDRELDCERFIDRAPAACAPRLRRDEFEVDLAQFPGKLDFELAQSPRGLSFEFSLTIDQLQV